MAGSINKVILVGNLGRDPEIRTTQDGREIANFSIATSDTWRDKSTGERRERTEWHRIVVFSEGLVNVIRNYVKKGSKVYIEGSLQTRKWQDQNGQERYTTEIVLQGYGATLTMLDSRNDGSSGGYQNNNAYNQQPQPAMAGAAPGGAPVASTAAPAADASQFVDDELDDDIPF